MAVQVKDLELQQDAARRAIAAKEQQLKPLDAQVRDRNRQAASLDSQMPMLYTVSTTSAVTAAESRACG